MANNKANVEVVLGFKANTDQAQKAVRELNNSLNKIQNLNLDTLGLNSELRDAANAAKLLQQHLQAATNVDTGKINIAQFSNNLRNANTSITELSQKLLGAGTTGQQAFLNLSRSIAQMDVPLKQTNATLNNMLTTLKNTIKWELSSNLVHGIESAFSNAISYAKNLNTSLTDIRVVSGQTVEQMAKFAVQANNAAKALGTTTKAYADASLIYYQQGDSAELAAKKAEITLKATNAAFSATAEEMSQMLTATWNSYQAGADELEHMVDVMANLGAHTATSMEEIATALQKVAATANNVGVSMEQMSAMISTVSSVTRQAPTVIGTAMNTILSRIGGLKLGETLEDGLNLNKYSAALQKIGVNVLDATGQLRDMGKVVDEIGVKWAGLTKGQQSAVAQVIGGTRQYTTMMALFANWDKQQENMALAQDSEGALEKMQQTRLEGWDAASKKMKASMETIYQDLINDQGMIKLINSLTKVIDQVENVVKSFGGLRGILVQIGTIATQIFSNNITSSIIKAGTSMSSFVNSFKNLGFTNQVQLFKDGKGGKFGSTINKGLTVGSHMAQALGMSTQQRQYRQGTNEMMLSAALGNDLVGDKTFVTQATNAQLLIEKKQQLIEVESTLSQQQKRNYEIVLNALDLEGKEIDELIAKDKERQQSVKDVTKEMLSSDSQKQAIQEARKSGEYTGKDENYGTFEAFVIGGLNLPGVSNLDQLTEKFKELYLNEQLAENITQQLETTLNSAAGDFTTFSGNIDHLLNLIKASNIEDNEIQRLTQQIRQALQDGDTEKLKVLLDELHEAVEQFKETNNTGEIEKAFTQLGRNQQLTTLKTQLDEQATSMQRAGVRTLEYQKKLESFNVKVSNTQQAFSGLLNATMAGTRAFSSFSNVIANWDSASAASKISGLTMALQGTISAASGAIKALEAMKVSSTLALGIVGVITATVVAIGGIVSGAIARQQQQLEDAADEASKRYGEYSSKQESKESNKSLVENYKELYNIYKTTGEGQDDLTESTKKLAEAYGIVDTAIDGTKEGFEEFNKEVEKTFSLTNQLKEAEESNTQADNLISKFVDSESKTYRENYNGGSAANFLTYTVPGQQADLKSLFSQILDLNLTKDSFLDLIGKFLHGINIDISSLIPNRDLNRSYGGDKGLALFDLLNDTTTREETINLLQSSGYANDIANQVRSNLAINNHGLGYFTENWNNPFIEAPDINLDLSSGTWGEKLGIDLSDLRNPATLQGIERAQQILRFKEIYDALGTVKFDDLETDQEKSDWETLNSLVSPYATNDQVVSAAQSQVDIDNLKTLASLTVSKQTTQSGQIWVEDFVPPKERLAMEKAGKERARGHYETINIPTPVYSDVTIEDYGLNNTSSISTIADVYSQLSEQFDKDEELRKKFNLNKDAEDYNQAKQKILQLFFSTNLGLKEQADYLTSFYNLIEGKGIDQNEANKMLADLEKEGITDWETFIEQYDYNYLRGLNKLSADSFTKAEESRTQQKSTEQIQNMYGKYDSISKHLSNTMSFDDYAAIEEAYSGVEGFDIKEFAKLGSVSEKRQFLQRYETKDAATVAKALQEQVDYNNAQINGEEISEEYRESLKTQNAELEKQIIIYSAIAEQTDTLANNYSSLGKILNDNYGSEDLERTAKFLNITDYDTITNSTKTEKAQHILSFLQENPMPTAPGDNATSEDIEEYNNNLKARAELLQQISDILNNSSVQQAEKASAAISGLSDDLQNIASGKGISAKTKTLLEAAGISTNIKSVADARDALQELQKQLQDSREKYRQNQEEIYGIDFRNFNKQEYEELAQNGDQNAIAILAAYNSWVQQGIEVANVAEDILKTYTTEISIAADDLAKKIENLQEIADKAKEKANVLASAITTGYLTAEQRTLFTDQEFNDWDTADIYGRGQIAGQALLDSLQAQVAIQTKSRESLQEVLNNESKMGLSAGWYSPFDFNKQILENSKLSSEAKNAIKKVYDQLESSEREGNFGTVWGNIIDKIKESAEATDDTIAQLKGSAIDAGVEITKQIQQQQQELTEKVINIWQNAFASIADAEIALLNGKSIGDSLDANGIKNLILNASGDLTKEELFSALNSTSRSGAEKVLHLGQYADSKINQTGAARFLSYDEKTGLLDNTQNYDQFILNATDKLMKEAEAFYNSLPKEIQTTYGETLADYQKQYVASELSGLTQEVFKEARATALMNEYEYTVQQPKQQRQEIFDAYQEKYSNAQEIMSALISGGRDKLNPDQWKELSELLGEDKETLESLSSDELIGKLQAKTNDLAGDVDKARNSLEQFTNALNQNAQYLGQNELGEDQFYFNGEITSMTPELGGGTKDYGYQQEGQEWLEKELESAQASWLSEVDTDLDKLDNLQKAINDTSTTSAELADKWLALTETLDMTNEEIAAAYEHMQMAQNGEYDMQMAIDEMTDAILRQGDVLIKDNATLRAYTKKWKENYFVSNKNREAYDATTLSQLRLGKAAKEINGVLNKANKTYGTSATKMSDLRKEAKKAGRSMSDFTDGVKDLSKEDKEMIKAFDDMYDGFDQLNDMGLEGFTDGFADSLANMDDTGQMFDTFMDQFVSDMQANGSNMVASVDSLKASLLNGVDTLGSETVARLETKGYDIQAAFNAVVQALISANGDATKVNWGTLVGVGGANMTQLMELCTAVLNALYEMQASGLFTVDGLIAAVQQAWSALSDVQGKYGGGGGSHNDDDQKKKGGGGGGKDKKKKVEGWKQPKEEKERYHEIRDQLDAQSKVLDKIDKLKERAFGKHHLDQINAEINALQKDLQLQEQYYREASKYYTANLQKLKDAGAKFNEDGTVQYEEFMDRIIHEYNQAVEAFNWSDQTALDELKLEQAKARYEDLTKLLEEYEEDLDLISEIQTQIIEEQNKISAAALEGIQYKIEVKLDLSERDIAMIEYFQDKWEELLSMQDDRMLKMTKQVQIYETNLTALGQSVRELQAKYNEGVLTEADYAEGMKDINDKILEQLENIQDVKKSLEELYGETLELASDKMEKYTSILDHAREVMENYIEMSELMGRGADYAGLEQVYQMQYDSSVANVEAAKMYLDTLKESRDEIERQVAENGWTDILQQQWYDVTEAITDGENDLLDKTQQALEDAQSMFENTMQKIIASFDDVLFNMKNGLSQLEDDYNYYNEQQERYLSTSKELYEVAKLNRQIDNSIQDATTKTSKERLKALQEVINKQSESTRLTEYDVEMLELQYKHALALQALEEAKNAKSTVRLTRDENGNYGYQYTADDNEIDDARQKVDDALQEINELAANRAAEIEQQVIETERQYRDELLAIAQDTTLTLEERQAKMEELTRRHNETLQFYNEQYTNATNALITNQEYVYQRYGVTILENTGMIQDQMNATVKAMIDKTSDYATYLEEQMAPGGQIYEALAKYKRDMGIVEDASGLSWSDMTGSIEDYQKANDDAKQSIAEVNDVLQQTLVGVADVTEQWDRHIKSLEAVIDLYEKLGQSAADAVARVADVEGLYGTAIGGMAGINAQAGVTGLTTKQQWQYTWGPSNGLFGVHSAYDSEAAALAGAKEDIKAQFQNLIKEGEDDAETEQVRRQAEAWMNEAMKTIKVTSYLSGGLADYTGPAWLDGSKSSPELVLNSRDTTNILSAVDIVRALDEETLRQMTNMMHYSAVSALMGVGSGLGPAGVNPFAQTLDQNVHITADFPNVTDKNEIIEAFDDLVNLASQYAGRG